MSAIDIGQAQREQLSAMISDYGTPFSHAAILARSLGIPAVMGITGLLLAQIDGLKLMVDGSAGHVHLRLNPAMGLMLLEMGFEGLSMSHAALPRVKWVVRSTSFHHMRSLATQALLHERPDMIRRLLQDAPTGIGLDRLLSEPALAHAAPQ